MRFYMLFQVLQHFIIKSLMIAEINKIYSKEFYKPIKMEMLCVVEQNLIL